MSIGQLTIGIVERHKIEVIVIEKLGYVSVARLVPIDQLVCQILDDHGRDPLHTC